MGAHVEVGFRVEFMRQSQKARTRRCHAPRTAVRFSPLAAVVGFLRLPPQSSVPPKKMESKTSLLFQTMVGWTWMYALTFQLQ